MAQSSGKPNIVKDPYVKTYFLILSRHILPEPVYVSTSFKNVLPKYFIPDSSFIYILVGLKLVLIKSVMSLDE